MPKKWIKDATSNAHGQFRAKAEAAGKTTREFAKEHEHDSGKTGKQARLAETLMGMNHGSQKKKTDRSLVYNHPSSRSK
jgi:hypothetical protein